MKEIPLTKGLVALVDDIDFARLSAHKWFALNGRCNKFYAARHTPGNHSQLILMHREVLNFPDSEVDHRNSDSLDNQRENLRPATRKQQCGNSVKKPGHKTPYKGVTVGYGGTSFQATIGHPKRYLGTFRCAHEAALAYDREAIKEWGEFAKLNFPNTDLSVTPTRLLRGDSTRGKPKSSEHRAAISKMLTGMPKSPEHCAAMSAARMGVPRSPYRRAAK